MISFSFHLIAMNEAKRRSVARLRPWFKTASFIVARHIAFVNVYGDFFSCAVYYSPKSSALWQTKVVFCLTDIAADLLPERLNAAEPDFWAHVFEKFHTKLLPVQILRGV